MRITLGLEYDGAAFTGWQSQPDGASAQDALETALKNLCGSPLRTFAAGRTDAGVHASLQIIHFTPPSNRPLPLSAWTRGTNANLHRSAAVLWAREMPDDFHARFSRPRAALPIPPAESPAAPRPVARQSRLALRPSGTKTQCNPPPTY